MAWDWLDDKLLGNSGADTEAALRNPITAFNFVLEVEGGYFMALKSVRVFNKENEYEYIREGGVNDYVHMRRKPISKPFTFQVERYVGTERFLDPLANGTELMLPVILYVYRHKARSAVTESAPAWPARIYTFTGCVVTAKEYGELNAEKSAILTETTTIAYRELMVVTNPFEGSQELPNWEFPHEETADHFPKGKYANMLSTQKDPEYYKKETVTLADGSTNSIWVKKDPEATEGDAYLKPWNIKENKTDPKVYKANDTAIRNDSSIYDKDKDGNRIRIDSEAKPHIDEFKNDTKAKWANSKAQVSDQYYEEKTSEDGIKRTVKKEDGGKYTKPRAEEFRTDVKANWANKRNETSSSHYSAKPGEGGWEMTDGKSKPRWDIRQNKENPQPINAVPAENGDVLPPVKEPWDIIKNKKNPKPKYAERAKNGDKLQPAKVPWNIKDNTTDPKPKYAKKAKNGDKLQPPKEPWDIKNNKTNPKPAYAIPAKNGDGLQPVKGPWDMKSNKETPKTSYAIPATNGDGKQPAKEPWDIKSNIGNPKTSYAIPATNGDGKQPAKDPWDIKANTSNPQVSYAKPAENGDKKQPVKEPWDIKANTKNPLPKYATESPKDHEKPEVVKWPPTRRALMADTLSKK